MNEAQTRFNKIDPVHSGTDPTVHILDNSQVHSGECTAEPTLLCILKEETKSVNTLSSAQRNRPYCAHNGTAPVVDFTTLKRYL